MSGDAGHALHLHSRANPLVARWRRLAQGGGAYRRLGQVWLEGEHLCRALRDRGLAGRMLLQVHDELVFEVASGEREALEVLVREQMAAAADLTVPLDVSVGTGSSWHEAAH